MSRRTRSFFFDNKNGKLFTGITFTLKDIANEVEGVSDIDGTKVSDFARSAIQTSVEPFLDSDTVIMTAAATDNRIQAVTTSIIDSAPGALDTLNELAAALGDDANFSTTVTNSIATKANSADLSTVATTGAYADLTGTPTLFSGAYADLTGTPTIPSAGSDNIGYLNIPLSGTTVNNSYTLITSDVGKHVRVGTGGSVTIPQAIFSTGDVVSIVNNSTSDITITCSINTAYIGGTNTNVDSVSLATRGIATNFFITGGICIINGNVS